MKSLKNIAVICLVLLVSACYTKPERYEFEKEREYELSFDKAWERVVEYFAKHSIGIKTIEKDSGIIYAETEFYSTNNKHHKKYFRYIDCGVMGRQNIEDAIGIISYNVFVKKLNESKTKPRIHATVNVKPIDVIVENPIAWEYEYERLRCNSTGRLEDDILDYIQNPREEVRFEF